MGWDKLAQLDAVREEGKRALLEYGEHELKMKQAEADKTMIEARVSAIDRASAELLAAKPNPEFFGTSQDLAVWRSKLDELAAKRMEFMTEVRGLNSIISTERTAAIKLAHQIEGLRHSARNLEAVVEGRSPASGFEGGVYRV
jgi:hypothetical protein